MRGKKIEVWKPIRNDIAHISRHTHHTRHIFLYEHSIIIILPSGNIIRSVDLLYLLSQAVRKQKGEVTFSEIPWSETIFFVNASRAICREQLSRSTILSKLRPVHYCGTEISSVPTTERAVVRIGLCVRPSLSPAPTLVSGFSLPIFPRNP